MKKVILIRHAESVTNIGELVLHKNIIRLSENGQKDSEELSEKISKPDRIILSKYIRTIETAEPIFNKFPESEVHLWYDLHEFDYVNPVNLIHLNPEQRELTEQSYWGTLDPFIKDDPKRENFKEFVDRIIKIIEKLQKIKSGVNYIFTHGHVIRLLLVLLDTNSSFLKSVRNDCFYKQVMDKFVDSLKTDIKNLYEIEVTNLLLQTEFK